MIRVYKPYWEWEEIGYNMWGSVDDRAGFLLEAIAFTGDAEAYGQAMIRVVDLWPNSCAHNLTNKTQNRRAWVGHAACALEFRCPEDIVREAWGHLTDNQRIEANLKADIAIKYWEEKCQK